MKKNEKEECLSVDEIRRRFRLQEEYDKFDRLSVIELLKRQRDVLVSVINILDVVIQGEEK